MSREKDSQAAWSGVGAGASNHAGCANLGSGHEIGADYRHWAEWRTFREMVPLTGASRVAELGAGNGRWLESLGPVVRECVGVDYSQPMLDLARQRLERAGLRNCTLALGSVTADVLDGLFDIIYFSGCLQYLDDGDMLRALEAAVPHLRPGGLLIDRTTISLGARVEGTAAQRFSLYRSLEEHLRPFAQVGLSFVERRPSYDWFWLPRVLRVGLLDRPLTELFRATAPQSYRLAGLISRLHSRYLPSQHELEYSHDFFLFRRGA